MYISKQSWCLTGILAASLIIIVTGCSQKAITYGQVPYAPNRLEWLELKLTAELGHRTMTFEEELIVRFKAIPETDTIYLLIWYHQDTQANFLQETIKAFKDLAMEEIEEMGWDDWVKLEIKSNEAGKDIQFGH